MAKITDKKKDRWLSMIWKSREIYRKVYEEIIACGVTDDRIDSLSNLITGFAEAEEDIDRL
jgi:hypothetical protein